MGAGKGGDGGGADAAAAQEAAQPVVLKMDLHCAGCADKVKKAIKRMPGVESIVADVAGKRVIVGGKADAAALKARIEAKTKKAVEVLSAGSSGANKSAAGAGEKSVDKDGGGGEGKGDKDASPKEEKEKKQSSEETKPKEDTVLLKIRLHCSGCADRIRRRIYKFKGVKNVVLDENGVSDEVKVTGTMDVPALLAYLRDKINRPVDAVAPGKKGDSGGGGDGKKDKSGDIDKNKDFSPASGGGDDSKDKAKSIDAAGPSTAAAAAFMAAPAEASTHHVAPPYGFVAYPQQGPAASSSYYPSYYDYGNADGMGMGYSNNSTYSYHQQQPYQYQYPHPDAGQQQAYPAPYPYMAPPSQLFSDENPNACSVM